MDYEAEITKLKKQIDVQNKRIARLENKLEEGKKIRLNDNVLYFKHIKKGVTIKDLAKYYGCSESTIKRHLAEYKKRRGIKND